MIRHIEVTDADILNVDVLSDDASCLGSTQSAYVTSDLDLDFDLLLLFLKCLIANSCLDYNSCIDLYCKRCNSHTLQGEYIVEEIQ